MVFWLFGKHCLGDMNVTCQLNIFLTVQLVSVQRFVQPDTSGQRIFMFRKDEKEHPEHPKAHSQHFVATDIQKRLPFGIPFAGTRFHPISTEHLQD